MNASVEDASFRLKYLGSFPSFAPISARYALLTGELPVRRRKYLRIETMVQPRRNATGKLLLKMLKSSNSHLRRALLMISPIEIAKVILLSGLPKLAPSIQDRCHFQISKGIPRYQCIRIVIKIEQMKSSDVIQKIIQSARSRTIHTWRKFLQQRK
jgi:hypothetical protein